jgi:hypothetical protein
MKKIAWLIMVVSLIVLFPAFLCADNNRPYQLIGREISPGIDLGDITVWALFVGKLFDSSWTERGRFTLILDHDGRNIESCGLETVLIRSKIILDFYSGARLVLVGPSGGRGPVTAHWFLDDPDCLDGDCPLIFADDYEHYLDLFDPEVDPNPMACDDADAFIAEVSEFEVTRQRFGSYGTRFTGGFVSGYLVHTPILSPAIFGVLYPNN